MEEKSDTQRLFHRVALRRARGVAGTQGDAKDERGMCWCARERERERLRVCREGKCIK